MFTLLLVVGCITDLRYRKIPNELVIALLVTGWLYTLASPDIARAFLLSLAGTAVGFGIWIAFYLFGVIGAGDVKFFAAAGAWLGPGPTWRAAFVAALIGGVLAVVFLVSERRLGEVLRRAALAVSSRSFASLPEQIVVQGVTHRPLPYGVALAIGALVTAWVPQLS